MLAQRLIVAIILLPLGVLVVSAGGWVLAAPLAVVLGYAAWEFWRMFEQGGYHPSAPVLIIGAAAMVVMRHVFSFTGSDVLISLLVLAAMGVQVFHMENGLRTAGVDFNITLGGILYLGWLGAYLVSLRNLPDGLWWFLLVLPAVWIADGGAYFIGSRFGKHKISKRVSPNKSWEGYVGGVIAAAAGTMLLASLWQMRAPLITPEKGLIIGLVVAAVAPLGDLGESMLKRSFGVKDTSNILPGHGGIMDRIDSWLWAAVIGYYIIFFAWI